MPEFDWTGTVDGKEVAIDKTKLITVENIKKVIDRTCEDIDDVAKVAGRSFKYVVYSNNTIKFFKNAYASDELALAAEAAFKEDETTGENPVVLNLPEEKYLDQVETKVVENFAFDAATYKGANDPDLDGKTVFVFGVKGDAGVSYSFINLQNFIDLYTIDANDETSSRALSIADNKLKLKISGAEGNALTTDENGLFVSDHAATFAAKANKVATATEGDIATLSAAGDLVDSGVAAADVVTKVAGAVEDNFVVFDANGKLKDSGKKAADFVVAEEGARLMTTAEGEKIAGIAIGAVKVTASDKNGYINITGADGTTVELQVYQEPEVATDEEIDALLNEVFGD